MNFADFIAGMQGGMHGGMHEMMQARLPPPPSKQEVDELYGRLGLEQGATANQIKKAYRKSALRNHPDRGGDPETFQKIQEAFDILGTDDKRTVFLRTGYKGLEMGLDPEDVDPEARRRREAKPEDLRLAMKCQLSDVLRPISREITVERAVVENGRQRAEQVTLHVNIPASAPDGFPIRLMESGHVVDGIAGDVLIRLRVRDHPDYERNGPDLLMQKRVSLRQALGGFVLPVSLIEGGSLDVAVPPGRALGDPLVVPGYGMPLTRAGIEAGRGSIIIILQVHMPSGTAGVKLSKEFAQMAWEELAPLAVSRGEGREEPMGQYNEERVAEAKRRAAAEAERRRRVEAGEIEDVARRGGRVSELVEVDYTTLDKEAMAERKKEWARNCGADRLEEEGQEGGQAVQCAQQ